MSYAKPKPKGKPGQGRRSKQTDSHRSDTARDRGNNRGGNNRGRNQRNRNHLRKQPKGKSESMMFPKDNHPIKIDPSLTKPRNVPARFLESKKKLLSKYKILTIQDPESWTESKGEGIKYVDLLKLPIYNDLDKIPENIVVKDKKPVFQPKSLSWEKYFEAVARNNQSGFVPKFSRPSQHPQKALKTPRTPRTGPSEDPYDDTNIEWDQSEAKEEETKGTPQKYKIQFKEISDNERNEIMKKISGSDLVKMEKPPLPQKKENDQFYKDESNVLVPSEETKKNGGEKVEVVKVEDIESGLIRKEEEKKEKEEMEMEETEEETEEPKVLSGEEIERQQIENAKQEENQSVGSEEESEEEFDPIKSDFQRMREMAELERMNASQDPNMINSMQFATQEQMNHYLSMQASQIQEHMQASQMQEQLQASQIQEQMQASQMQEQLQASQMHQFHQAQPDIQTQQMLEQLNQEELQKAIMQDPNAMFKYQQELMYNEINKNIQNIPAEGETNPFEPILRDNPTSQWMYKDPQGYMRGPFSCFDMYTWYNEGYFREDLELSLDGNNFFRLCDLRVVGQRSTLEDSSYSDDYSQYSETPEEQVYSPGGPLSPGMYPPQMQAYSAQNMPIPPQFPAGQPPQMAFPTMGQMAYEPSPNFGQDYTHGYYTPINPIGEGNMQLPPFPREN